MTFQSRWSGVRNGGSIAMFVALSVISSGCAMTQSTTTIRSSPGPVTQRLKLSREGAAPLTATFQQEGNAIVGQVKFAQNCVYEATRTVGREEVTTTQANKKSMTALMVAGGVLTLAGTALFVRWRLNTYRRRGGAEPSTGGWRRLERRPPVEKEPEAP